MNKYQKIDRDKLSPKGKTLYDKLKKKSNNFEDTDGKLGEILEAFYNKTQTKPAKAEPKKPAKSKPKAKAKSKPKAKAKTKAKAKAKKKTTKKATKSKSGNTGSFAKLRAAIAKRDGITYKQALPIAKKEYAKQKESITKKKRGKTESRLSAYKRKYKSRGTEDVKERGSMRALDIEKDSKIPALPRGKRVSKGTGANQYGKAKKGKVYYENRSNRTDVRQPSKKVAPPKLAKGGKVEFFDKDSTENSFRRKIWEGYKNVEGQESVGSFAHKVGNKIIGDYYLFTLSDFDEKFYSHLPLKQDEILFRTETKTGRISKSLPLVKVNIANGRVYFMSEDNDPYSDEDDKNPKFNTSSANVTYISLDSKLLDYAKGGKVDKSSQIFVLQDDDYGNELFRGVDELNEYLQEFNEGYGENYKTFEDFNKGESKQGRRIVRTYAKGGKISQDDKDRVLDNIDNEGIEYGIREYDEYTDIKDNQFQKLRKDYIVRAKQLERQAKKDEYYNDLVYNEGLDYTFTDYVDPEEVENEELKSKIKAYDKAKDRLLDYLGTKSKQVQVEYLKDDELLVPLRTGIGMFEDGGRINIVNEGVKFDKKKYKGVLGDFDKDGVPNIDDAKPLTKTGKQERVEQVELSKTFERLLKLKSQLDSTMNVAIDELDEVAPDGAEIYARTKTPYSILKKLVEKRLTDKNKGLTDLVGTTIAVDDYKDLRTVDKEIKKGAIGKVVEREDMYDSPKGGYRAVHYLVEADGYIIEVQLKTKRQKDVNVLSHNPYKKGTINKEYLLKLTNLANKADKGNKNAIKEFNEIMKDKEKVERQLDTSYEFGGEIRRDYDVNINSGVGTYAKGGITKGQTLAENFNMKDEVQNVEFWKNDVIVKDKQGKVKRIDLDKGERISLNAKGGKVNDIVQEFYGMNLNEIDGEGIDDVRKLKAIIFELNNRLEEERGILPFDSEAQGFDKDGNPYGYDNLPFAKGGEVKNGYIAMYKGKKIEVYANSSYAAQKKAAEMFNTKKSYDVRVYLAEQGGQPVMQSTMFNEGGELFDADTEVQYDHGGMLAKGGSVKDFEKGKWLQGKQWYISKGFGWVLERYKGDKLIEQYQINVVEGDDYDFIEYSPDKDGEILIPENVQIKVIRLLEKVNPKYDFGDEYVNQIRVNPYSTMYAKGGWIQDAVEEMKEKGTVGAFTKQAKRREMTPVEFAKMVLKKPQEYSKKTRERAQFVKNTNPELFSFGGEIRRDYDVNINSGVGTYAEGGKISEAGDTDFPSELLNYANGGEVYDLRDRLIDLGDDDFVEFQERQSDDPNSLYYTFKERLEDYHGEELYAKGGKVDNKLNMKILVALRYSDKMMNPLLEAMGLSNYKFNQSASTKQRKEVENALEYLIKKGYVKKDGSYYSKTQKGREWERENYRKYEKGGELMDADTQVDYAKGGSVKGKKVVRFYYDVYNNYDRYKSKGVGSLSGDYKLAYEKAIEKAEKDKKNGTYQFYRGSTPSKLNFAKGGKTQGYNSRLDESLGDRTGAEIDFEQKKKDRRDESKAMEKSSGKRAYSSVRTMDRKKKTYRRKK